MRGQRGFTLVEVMVSFVILGVVGMSLINLFQFQHQSQARQSEGVRATQNARAGLEMFVRELRNAGYDPRLLADAELTSMESDSVSWSADLNGDGDVDDFGGVGDEVVTYFYQPDSAALVRLVQGVQVQVADGVTGFSLEYLDGDGNATTDPDEVEQIGVEMVYQTPEGVLTGDLRTKVAVRNAIYAGSVFAGSPGGGGGGGGGAGGGTGGGDECDGEEDGDGDEDCEEDEDDGDGDEGKGKDKDKDKGNGKDKDKDNGKGKGKN